MDAVKDQQLRVVSEVSRGELKRKRESDFALDQVEIKRLKDDNSNLISILNTFQLSIRDVQKELERSQQEVSLLTGNLGRVQTDLKIARKQLCTLNRRLAIAAENKKEDLKLILELKQKIENLRHQSI